MSEMLWEDVWDDVNGHFEKTASAIRETNADLSWSCGHSENESFPFRAYASFMRRADPGADEDVVIALDVHKQGSEVRMTVDISRGNGEVLAVGPSMDLGLVTDTRTLREEIKGWVRSALDFVDAKRPLLQAELAPIDDE